MLLPLLQADWLLEQVANSGYPHLNSFFSDFFASSMVRTRTYVHVGCDNHNTFICACVIPYCPAVTPPLFATYFQEKKGGGRNNEGLYFRFAVKPPPPHEFAVLRSTKLCCEAEDENCFDRHALAVLKATYIRCHFFGKCLAAKLLPPATTAG